MSRFSFVESRLWFILTSVRSHTETWRGALRREGVKVIGLGETMQNVAGSHLTTTDIAPLLNPPRSLSHTHTHTHTRALAPWEMKMDDEHLAKQGCKKLRR